MNPLLIFTLMAVVGFGAIAQPIQNETQTLDTRSKHIVEISVFSAKGDLSGLKTRLEAGLNAGLTVNEIREVLVHLHAYCGFPRSIRGLQTFMEVLEERKARGIKDEVGRDASPISQEPATYLRGKKILSQLTGTPVDQPVVGYGAFAPVIDTFLKEHLFADLFERDVLRFAERELVTISVLATLGGVEPMLRSHMAICLRIGFSPGQLTAFTGIIKSAAGAKPAGTARKVLNEVLQNRS